jgi:hypothetical protein
MMVGKKQLKHLSTLGYSRVLADTARNLDFRGFWQYQHDNRKLYYRYYRTTFNCYDSTILFLTCWYRNSSVTRKIEKFVLTIWDDTQTQALFSENLKYYCFEERRFVQCVAMSRGKKYALTAYEKFTSIRKMKMTDFCKIIYLSFFV